MKRLLLLMCLLLTFARPALAEELPDEVTALLSAAHPDHTLAQVVSAYEPVIAVLSKEDEHVLCIAEKHSGEWALTVDNPTALHRGALPAFLWEGGMSLFYRYDDEKSGWYYDYHAQRTAQGWSQVDLIAYDLLNNHEHLVSWAEDGISVVVQSCDEDGNATDLYQAYPPYPQGQLAGKVNLATFDIEAFPAGMGELSLQAVLDEVSPGARAVDGALGKAFACLADMPDGTLRFLGGAWDEEKHTWHVTASTPLPEGTSCNAYHSGGDDLEIHLPQDGESYIIVSLQGDGRWQVSYIGREDWFGFGQNWIYTEDFRFHFGTVSIPLDVTAVDWHALPSTLEEAFSLMQRDDWAVVNNPNPQDRLHLRTEPSRSAASLGKYYNGTPVHVLRTSGNWAQVDLFGVQGWMMRQYLSFGENMEHVESAMPLLFVRDDLPYAAPLYRDTEGNRLTSMKEGSLSVLGVIGDDYYHVMGTYDPSVHGYMHQSDLFPGNG